MRVSVFVATSLDSFFVRKSGEHDRLDAAHAAVTEGENCGYVDRGITIGRFLATGLVDERTINCRSLRQEVRNS